ncbi:sigma-54-dependent transcriptional regulator [Usitatibacter palustris]|uniref:Regulatory protein AtoC n=1 Tax=Usitatibacter palustris TaxID=2732487 RepID=A0A6M4H9G6_9PROT|nr:sigma-54 dependent transcriptional regulator [Usitatibacter palustris]QJR16389.1 Regulatory protein AtoC [Usitatibacter palustris]
MKKASLLVVDDDPLIVESLAYALGEDHDVVHAMDRESAVRELRKGWRPDLALIDLGLPPVAHLPNEGFKLIGDLLAHAPGVRILVLTGQNEESNARRARALGAVELVPKPCDPNYLRTVLARALATPSPDRPDDDGQARRIIGESPPILKLRSQIDLYATSAFPALIEGESGSGKERVAWSLHHLSPRARHPFLALNCAAISPSLVEPTLFGYAKGAFTGAQTARTGYFEDAGDGTLFLDEIGELPVDLQAKLLRVLENGEYQRVGETQTRVSGARIVAATNRDLRAAVREGRFRADLFHRLSVFTLQVPPLRELGEDKLRLLDYYVPLVAIKSGTQPIVLDGGARARWLGYEFPGNVRELRNVLIRLTAKFGGHTVGEAELEAELAPVAPGAASNDDPAAKARAELASGRPFSLDAALKAVEAAYLDAAIEVAQGNMSQAAKLLGVSRSTLYSRLEAAGRAGAKLGSPDPGEGRQP